MFPRPLILTVAALLLAPTAAFAAVPSTIPFQSRLVDASGSPVAPGTVCQFAIFTTLAGGTAVWGPETHTVTPVNGVVSLFLGDGDTPDPIDESVFAAGDRFLEVTVGGETLTPRIRMTTTGYAFRAESVTAGAITSTALANNSVNGAKVADNSLTSADLATNSVTASEIASGAVGNAELANAAVSSAKIANNAINTNHIASDTINAGDIAGNAVGASELADNSVDSAAIVDGAITAADLGTNSVAAAEIASGAVGASELAANAVNDAKILDEPGAAYRVDTNDDAITAVEAVSSRQITLPTSGFVIAIGSATAETNHNPLIPSIVELSINTTATAHNDGSKVTWLVPIGDTAGIHRVPMSTTRVLSLGSGSHTISLNASAPSGVDLETTDARISLIFVPTSYGTISSETLSGPVEIPADGLASR